MIAVFLLILVAKGLSNQEINFISSNKANWEIFGFHRLMCSNVRSYEKFCPPAGRPCRIILQVHLFALFVADVFVIDFDVSLAKSCCVRRLFCALVAISTKLALI
jgi:hypothetical protein